MQSHADFHYISVILLSPPASTVITSNCTHGDVRLAGSGVPYSGRVEVCVHGVWGSVCDEDWDEEDANVVCRQLDYFSNGKPAVLHALFMHFSSCVESEPQKWSQE